MGLPTNVSTLLSGNTVEWARIEFKESWDPEASLKTICAFANDLDNWGGGYLVIGVREQNGVPQYPLLGVPAEKIDGCLNDILNKCRLIQPEYLPIAEVVDYEDKKFIALWAPGGNLRPYTAPKTMEKQNREKIPYIRRMSSTIIPSEAEKGELYGLANNILFDDRTNHDADLADLNITLIQSYLKEVESSVSLEGLKKYQVSSRRYRNRRIGEFLKELHLTEGRNTGFHKILAALKKNGSPLPEFETDEDHSYFITRFFVREGFHDPHQAEAVRENKHLIESALRIAEEQSAYSASEKKTIRKFLGDLMGEE